MVKIQGRGRLLTDTDISGDRKGRQPEHRVGVLDQEP